MTDPRNDQEEPTQAAHQGPTLGSMRLALLAVGLGMTLAPLNSTMIAVALPRIIDGFGIGYGSASWLVTAYLIAMASLQPLGGRLGDVIGRRRLVLLGVLGFGAASMAAALAPSIWPLVTFRVLQAASGAVIVPNGFALMRELVPEHRRARAFGLLGAGFAVAAAIGPTIGGVILELVGWRAIFAVSMLVVTPAFLIGWRNLPAPAAAARGERADLAGAFLLPATLVGISGVLVASGRGVPPWTLAVGTFVTALSAALLMYLELRHPDPVFQPRLFRIRSFAAAGVGIGFGNLAMYSLLLTVPLLLAGREGSSSLESGLILTVMSAAMIVLSPSGGHLADRFGRRIPAAFGMGLMALGAVPTALFGAEIAVPPLLVGLALVGLGLGMATPAIQTSAVESVPANQAGVASGLYSTNRYLGSIVGSAVLAALLGSGAADPSGIDAVFVIILVSAVVAATASLFLRPFPTETGAGA